ncbi:MAG: AAA family ATPase [Polyangiaceae bacterium]
MGEELAAGGGDAGQSLFDAGIGGGSVKRVLDALRAEAIGSTVRGPTRGRYS